MKLEIIQHPSGEPIPLILGNDGFPAPAPSEWLISRRSLSTNTLIRNARELVISLSWFEEQGIDLEQRIRSDRMFTEAELNGGLIERLRHSVKDAAPEVEVRGRSLARLRSAKVAVGEETFNQRLGTARAFLVWCFGVRIQTLSSRDPAYERVKDHLKLVERILDKAFISQASPVSAMKKALSEPDRAALESAVSYKNPEAYGKNEAVLFRNYVCVKIMIGYGLRMGELLSLRVRDIVFGRISELHVERRPADPSDTRRIKPKVKRLGRVLPIDNPEFERELAEYIDVHRESMMEYGDARDHDYLIVSDVGEPLSLNALGEYFRKVRKKFPGALPKNLTSKMMRHTFSTAAEKQLRAAGFDEDSRRQALASWRGDSTLTAQDTYIRAGIVEEANNALSSYQAHLIPEFKK
ncbi:tyrosine-type recombinase/integrase [Pseudomonas kitaguniensis]|uniref:tyrosine-type recombinase/integrase n=1 Tax=Pseudomonas kitaguniensis TaxID=2607908 RepID=UPI003D047446